MAELDTDGRAPRRWRHQMLLVESPAENVVRGWLTGEMYRDQPPQRRRRRPKTSQRRQRRR